MNNLKIKHQTIFVVIGMLLMISVIGTTGYLFLINGEYYRGIMTFVILFIGIIGYYKII
jgi:hypothetical protein